MNNNQNVKYLFLIVLGFCVLYFFFFSNKCIGPINEEPYDIIEIPIIKNQKVKIPNILKIKIKKIENNNSINKNQKLFNENDFNPVKKTSLSKEFNKDFFRFRNVINNNSSHLIENSIDKINSMRLTGELNFINPSNPIKIKDLYDNLLKPLDRNSNSCVRVPNIENLDRGGIYSGIPFEISSKEWIYDNENTLNGGSIGGNLLPNDPYKSNYF